MVQDVRQIILTQEELQSAIECYRRITPNFLPQGQIVKCIPVDDTLHISVQTPAPNAPQQQDFVFRGQDAVKPLIRFCIENNIMLPMNGFKSLHSQEGVASLCIILTLNLDEQQETGAKKIPSFGPADILKFNRARA